MANIKAEIRGELLKSDGFNKWKRLIFQNINNDLIDIYKEQGLEGKEEIISHVKSKLKIKNKSILKTVKYKIYDNNKSKLPALTIGTRLPILLSHNDGATIKSKNKTFIAIPFKNFKSGKRIGKKQFSNFLNQALKEKKIYFKNINIGTIGIFSNFYTETLKATKTVKKKPKLIGYLIRKTILKKRLNIDNILDKRKDKIYNKIKEKFK